MPRIERRRALAFMAARHDLTREGRVVGPERQDIGGRHDPRPNLPQPLSQLLSVTNLVFSTVVWMHLR
jgi:hypothetical protein